jgi:hypothetical protein
MGSIRRAMAVVFRFGDCPMAIAVYRIEDGGVIAVRYPETLELVEH